MSIFTMAWESGGDAQGDTYSAVENVSGSQAGDIITGDPFTANQLFGLGGNDTLIGQGGHDFMLGGEGNDHIFGGTGRDVMRGNAGADTLDGGSQEDWIQYNDAPGRVEFSLQAQAGYVGDAAGDVYISIENARGSNFDDYIVGSTGRNQILAQEGDDIVFTTGGNDVVWGEGGDDQLIGSSAGETFYGGTGADWIDGGGGNDWARYWDASSGVTVNLLFKVGTVGEAAGDVLTNIEYLWGSDHADILIGDHGVNQIRGGGGNDQITGLKGNDILEGFGGVDTFIFQSRRWD